jgi:pimeloyl-ACP methyl ester carboxylesterase
LSSIRQANHHHVKPAGDSAGQPLNRVFERYKVDIPTAVVVTTRDRIVPADRQLGLARTIPGASVHEVDADHAVCITAPQVFARTLLEACWSVEPGRGRDDPRFGAA